MFISDSHEKKSSFRTVDSDLSDDLIEALAEQFLSDGTDALISCLSVFQGFIE